MTEEEQLLFQNMLEEEAHQKKLETIIDKELHEHAFETEADNTLLALIQDNLQSRIATGRKPAKLRRLNWLRVAAAAIFIMLLGSGVFVWWRFQSQPQENITVQAKPAGQQDIAPGSNKAVLQLADGTKIQLQDVEEGTLAKQGNTQVIKFDSGQLLYDRINGTTGELLYNTIYTPKGGQYLLTLADGSKVWLNAASSLRFPAGFSGDKRMVELTGEGYFEIAKNTSMPFHVQVNGVDIRVLGTHFNVNAYDDETSLRTTLLEGSVRVSKGEQTTLLQPGQQAAVDEAGQIAIARQVDLEEVMAWKNGLFHFKSADLETILRQAARWYNVEFQYQQKISDRFSGQISRNVNLSQLLKILELTGRVHFEIKGRTIVVKP